AFVEPKIVEVRDLAVFVDQAGLVVPMEDVDELENILLDRLGRIIKRGNERKQVVGADVIGLEHALAAHAVTLFRPAAGIKASAHDTALFVNGDVGAQEATVFDQVGGSSQTCDSSTDYVRLASFCDCEITHFSLLKMKRLRLCLRLRGHHQNA